MGIEWSHSGALRFQWLGLHILLCMYNTKNIGLKRSAGTTPYWKALELVRHLLGAMQAEHVCIEWFYSGALMCPMQGLHILLSI